MTYAKAKDGVNLYYESVGAGIPIVFVHEFAGDHQSWELQVRHFSRRYRCITLAARGYPPSDVPADSDSYSQLIATDDIKAVMDHADVSRAHIVGLSMGGYATLHFGFRYPGSALSLCVGSCGYGSVENAGARFADEAEAMASEIEAIGAQRFAQSYAHTPVRKPFELKDPPGFQQFKARLEGQSQMGMVNTQRGLQKRRPSLYSLTDEMKALRLPTLIICGDEDDPCLAPALLMKNQISSSDLSVLPNSGHSINQEEPADYNRILEAFFAKAESGRHCKSRLIK
ncbi:alpha/beta fold hydrolase [Paraburkholderia xenovorans]